jgi:hypothetical protein
MATQLEVVLNGSPNRYAVANHLTGPLKGTPRFITEFVPSFRESVTAGGPPQPDDISGITNLRFPNFTKGFGRRRIDSDSAFKPSEYRHVHDARADTRWADSSYLPILEEDSTGEVEMVRASTRFKGALWTVWVGISGSSGERTEAREVDSSGNFTGGGNVHADASNKSIPQDLIAHKDRMVCLLVRGATHLVYHSTDGVTWTAATTQVPATLINTISAHEETPFGLLASVGDEAVAILYHETNGTITFASSTDKGVTWTDEAVDIQSTSGPLGVAVYPGIDDADKLYVLTSEALFEVDTGPSTWTITNLPVVGTGSVNASRRMVVHNGEVLLTTSTDGSTPFDIISMNNGDGVRRIISGGGLDKGDGVVEALLGPVRRMVSAGEQLIVVAGGTASGRNAHVLIRMENGTWHYMVHDTTENQVMPWVDVDGLRIHYAKRTSSTATTGHFLDNALVNPRAGVSIKRASSGYIDLPYLDAGFPGDQGAWLQVLINAEDLSATNSNEYINVDYGIDDGSGGLQAQSNTDLGDFLSGTTSIDFASGAGVSSVNLGLRVNLHRDGSVNTHTPKLKDVRIAVLKEPPIRDRFIFTIDVRATMDLTKRTAENIITDWETARNLKTLPTFTYGPVTTSRYVKVRQARWVVQITEGASTPGAIQSLAQVQREGYIEVVVEEVV